MARKNLWADYEPPSPKVEGPGLVLMFGASSKPFAQLICSDIHPCKRCKSKGYIDGKACFKCRGTGLSDIPKGSLCTCSVCHKSGVDHLPIMKRDPATDPKPEPKAPAPPDEDASKSRKQKRGVTYAY